MSSGESDTDTLERHYRVTLDFRVLARPINDEVRQESFFFREKIAGDSDAQYAEEVDRQRRLYRLLRGDRQALERYLLSVLTQEAGNFVYQGLADAFDAADEDEVLETLYRGMGQEDARYFEECRQMAALTENTDLISTAFKVEWVGAEIEELSRRVEGDVKRAEIVDRTRTRLVRKMIR